MILKKKNLSFNALSVFQNWLINEFTIIDWIFRSDEEEDGEALAGWPPVNYWRKKLRSSGGGNYGDDEVEVAGNYDHHRHGCGGVTRSKKSMYVKVKMEGVGIARKVDLTVHRSFHTLKETLMHMFGKCMYIITYAKSWLFFNFQVRN